MQKIVSECQPGVHLHTIVRAEEIGFERVDISPTEEVLQVSAFRMHEGHTFRPHKHVPHARTYHIPQESWVVLAGRVKVTLFDFDGKVLAEPVLGPGDASITYLGGHTYTAMEEGSFVFEYKTGPYYGQKSDKVFYDEH